MSTLTNVAWENLKWSQIRFRVSRTQNRIYKAKRADKIKVVHYLQLKLINSLDAKLLSVLQLTILNKGKKTSGVDKVKIVDNDEKLKLAINLKLNGSIKAQPVRRGWIPKPGKTEKRPLGIPTIVDRARQNLLKLAIEPEWYLIAVFEPNSYGFRPGRSCQDAIEAIFSNLHFNKTKYIYDAGIRKCFDKIDQSLDALLKKLNTIPQFENQIKAWLKTGILEGYVNSRNENKIEISTTGTPQGGSLIISPLLANIALHGLEEHLKTYVAKNCAKLLNKKRYGSEKLKQTCGVIRYADDFVIINENLEVIKLLVAETRTWLKDIGLEINEEKSKIINSSNGFNFLGFSIITNRRGRVLTQPYKVKIYPSKESQLRFSNNIRKVIKYNKSATSYQLIQKLRPILLGWGNYFKYSECKDVVKKLDHALFGALRAWVFRRDTRNGRLKIRQKYFPSSQKYNFQGREYNDNWVLVRKLTTKRGTFENFLPRLSWLQSTKHVKIKGDHSPYDGDYVYWTNRMEKHSQYPISIRTLLKKQKFVCNLCKIRFNTGDTFEIDHIIPKSQGGSIKDAYENLQLVHKTCHIKKTKLNLTFRERIIELIENKITK
jgi:RNA-directed DNA polymerase